jgi:hypothetical protein
MDHGRLYEEGATGKKTTDTTLNANKVRRIQSSFKT